MAVSTTAVAGAVALPDGSAAVDGDKIVFTRRRAGVSNGAMVMHGQVAAIVSGGQISVTLSRDDDGISVYDVSYRYFNLASRGWITASIGPIVIDGPGPYTLADLVEQTVRIPSSVKSEASIKRGDTLSLGMIWVGDFHQRLDHTGVDIAASLLGPDGELRALTVTKLSPATDGEVEISMTAAETADLPLGHHQIDIKFSTVSRVSRTMTGTITVLQEITP
ncbi:hypothetical protein [Paenirhodobacter populi]|uniref:hypothetical protein n=1 Tax=Paenirhodobacter populi TaxID=2306993 RepID=UPI000FE3CB4E|nr:hypothetical protein [Sinirhodobacter populi]RWR09815.1 hypothetical protein D2T32_05600 [Sinirhodobacter populi]